MKFLTNLTLGKKITLLTTLGLLLGVGVFSSLGMRAVNRATETMLEDRLTTASLVGDYLDEALRRALVEVENTAQSIDGDSSGNLDSLIAALDSRYSQLSISTRGIYLLDEKGQVVASKPGDTLILKGADISSYPGINEAIGGKPAISGLVSAPMTNVPVIFLASPTANKGVLAVAIDLAQSSIAGFVQPIRLGQTGYVEIVDQNGIVLARTEPGPKLSPFEKSDHSGRFASLISAGKPTRGVCHTCHESEQKVATRDVLAFVPLTETHWGVVIRQSEEEALASSRELRQSLLMFGIGLVTIALLFVLVTTRDIGSRIQMLTAASRKMALGDLVTPVTTSGRDEVGILAETLDGMRTKLKTSYNELEQKTKELASLLAVSEILTSTFDLPHLLDAVVAKAVEVVPGTDGGVLLLQDANRGGLLLQCAIGLDKDALGSLVSKLNGSAVAEPGTQSKDTCAEVVAAFLSSDVLRSRVRSSICAEVFNRERHSGTLIMVSFKDSKAFSESDRRLLQAIADYLAIAIDRAQLTKEAEEAIGLREADRLRSQFISSVSHELRTPLTFIKGCATSLLRHDVSWDGATEREFLRVIDDKTDELRDLIDKLLQSAKLEAGALRLEKEPVLMPRLAQRVVAELAPRAKKHKLTLNFSPSFPVVEADVRCMEQVVRNLVENAIKYSPENSEIMIAGETRNKEVVVSVSDQGIGIAPEHRQKLFERFYRVDSPLTRGTPGSGLGLFITKGHVEAHGGKVWVESTPGKGSTFYFSLPLEPVETAVKD